MPTITDALVPVLVVGSMFLFAAFFVLTLVYVTARYGRNIRLDLSARRLRLDISSSHDPEQESTRR